MKFKVGDEVRCIKIIEEDDDTDFSYLLGQVGTITSIDRQDDINVRWPSDRQSLCMYPEELAEYHPIIVPEALFTI